MNIKQRALELLQEESMRGRVPSEVQDLLREVAALEPVAYVNTCFLFDSEVYRDETNSTAILWRLPRGGKSEVAIYTLTGATHE